MISRGRQNICRRPCHTPKISRKFSLEWNFGLWCYGRDENRIWNPPALVQLFQDIFSQGTWQAVSMDVWERCPVVSAFSPVSLRWWSSILPFCRWNFRIRGHLTHTSHPRIFSFQEFEHIFRSYFTSTCPVFNLLTATRTSAAVMVVSPSKCTSCV